MSKTIEEIKNEWARTLNNGHGRLCKNWKEYIKTNTIDDEDIDEIAERYAQSQTQELTEWKESASKVFKNLDLQDIGKTLGIGLGEDVSTNVLPKIKEIQNQNAELVRMLVKCKALCDTLMIDIIAREIGDLLTKHNHLNKKP